MPPNLSLAPTETDRQDRHRHGLVILGYGLETGDASWRFFLPPIPDYYHPSSSGDLLDATTAAAVQLYNGETCFGDAQRLATVQRMLVDDDAKLGVVDLLGMRGMRRHEFACSQLDAIVGQHIAATG